MTRGIEDLVSADATLVSRRAFTDEACPSSDDLALLAA